MNKRMRELEKQCWDYQTNHLNTDKFAELIVQECVNIVEGLSPGYQDYRNQIEDAFRKDCVAKIKHEFGVKS